MSTMSRGPYEMSMRPSAANSLPTLCTGERRSGQDEQSFERSTVSMDAAEFCRGQVERAQLTERGNSTRRHGAHAAASGVRGAAYCRWK